ncbi:MAG: sensor histidine kinase [Methanomassiliicoccales archaeon]
MNSKPGLSRRITLYLVIVAVASVIISSLLVLGVFRQQFSAYVNRGNQQLAEQWAPLVIGYYQANAGFTGLQEAMIFNDIPGNPDRQKHGPDFGSPFMRGRRLVITDISNRVVADSELMMLGKTIEPKSLKTTQIKMLINNHEIGSIYLFSPLTVGLSSLERDFISQTTKITIGMVLTIGLMALILGWLLGRRIAVPLGEISQAMHRLAGGDLKARVTPRGDPDLTILGQDFNQMAERLEETEQARQRLTSDVAHELRTPLALLRGQLENMQHAGQVLTEESVTLLLDEVIRLTRLVKDLEDISLAESKAMVLNLVDLPLHRLWERLAPVQLAMEDAGISYGIEVSPELTSVKADETRLLQIMINLLSNAMQHLSTGGDVQIKVTCQNDQAKFIISDNGPGINPLDLPHVFDRFYRTDTSRNRLQGGMGLGLAIARGLVEAHGGTMGVESTVGVGSSFYFTLPGQGK